MLLEDLANELVLHIFQSCSSISDVLNLAATCQQFRSVFATSQRLPILYKAAEVDFGPLQDAIQIVTHNASQPARLVRNVPLSLALLKQLVAVGTAAKKWEEIYPARKWKHNSEDRRLLTLAERFNLRRAVYRLWLYSRAFHNARYVRTTRLHRQNVLERAELLHNWTTAELAEIEDMREVIRDVLHSHICPSNGTIQRKFRNRHPDSDHQLVFNNAYLNYHTNLPISTFQLHYHSTHQISASSTTISHNLKYQSSAHHEPGGEGWGDDIPHYYVVEDMLKLDPGQVLWLKENAPLKGMVESYVRELGAWFENNGETFGQTLEWVIRERGEDVEELREGIREGEQGIV